MQRRRGSNLHHHPTELVSVARGPVHYLSSLSLVHRPISTETSSVGIAPLPQPGARFADDSKLAGPMLTV